MKKAVKKSTHDKKAEPMKLPKVQAGLPLEEAVTPALEAQTVDCKACGHPAPMHYGSANRWCNTSGCDCQALA